MKLTSALVAAAAVAAAGSVGVIGAPIATADTTTTTIGNEARLVDGDAIQGWTISGLKTSSDVIPHQVVGTLWEATATDEAIQGGATPVVSNFNARAKNGQTYRVLFGAATPQGVNPATLTQGQETTGKIYFDVTGESPDSVVYNAGGQERLLWLQPPPPPRTTPSSPSSRGSSASPAATPSTEDAEGALDEILDEELPAEGTPAAEPAATLPEGSTGTPIPEGSAGTPLPEGSAGTPVSPTPEAPVGTEGSPQPASVGEAPAAGSQGTPLPADASAPAPRTAPGPVPGPASLAPGPVAPTSPTVVVPPPA